MRVRVCVGRGGSPVLATWFHHLVPASDCGVCVCVGVCLCVSVCVWVYVGGEGAGLGSFICFSMSFLNESVY